MKCNFSMAEYWKHILKNWTPLLHFRGRTEADWRAWRRKAMPKLLELLGDFPPPVPLKPRIENRVVNGNIIRERVVFEGDKFMSIPCYVLRSRTMKANRSHAAILCSHGHGAFGKDAVAGLRTSPQLEENIKSHNYDYGRQMAEAGFLTICPDLRVFGERSDGPDPFPGRDKCNVNFIEGAMLGIYTLTLNIWDMKRCIDYLQTRREVNPDRIGMMGLSQGGTMTTFTTAVEPRIKAANIIGYVNSWRAFAFRGNICGSQIVPHIYRYFDVDDIAGLIAPRPLLLDMGIHDDCFYIQDLLEGHVRVKRIYKAAGVPDRLWSDIHEGGHAFGGNKAVDFFRQYL